MVLQWSAETNASITAIFFKWLVGPLETKEVDVDFEGEKRTWRSGVQIKKCRYLEQSGCVGMCINMCKVDLQNPSLQCSLDALSGCTANDEHHRHLRFSSCDARF